MSPTLTRLRGAVNDRSVSDFPALNSLRILASKTPTVMIVSSFKRLSKGAIEILGEKGPPFPPASAP